MTKERFVYIIIAVVFCGALMSFFGRPKAPNLELVSAEQISPGAITQWQGDSTLADRVLNSAHMALVLVQSPYSPDNSQALEALRSWARENYLADKGFLHPISLDTSYNRTDTVFGALTSSLLSAPYYWLRERTGDLVKNRVAMFQMTPQSTTLADTYFELFGDSPEAAVLLARYQSDRAKMSLDVVMSSFVWLAAFIAGLVYVFAEPVRKLRFIRLERTFASAWILLGAFYFLSACVQNEVGTFFAALISTFMGVYALRPFLFKSSQVGEPGVKFMRTNPVFIAVFVWFSFTLVAIQTLTWIKTPLMAANPDPLTLLFSALSGDFMHDHAAAKQTVKYLLGFVWLGIATWVLWVRHRDGESFVEDGLLEKLEDPADAASPQLASISSRRR